MRRSSRLLVFTGAVLVPDAVPAQSADVLTSPVGRPKNREAVLLFARAYCDYSRAVSRAQTAPLLGPWIMGSAGTTLIDDGAQTTDVIAGPNLRVRAGVGFSPTMLAEGLFTRTRAEKDCIRFSIGTELEMTSSATLQDADAAGWSARARVLEDALPEAEQIVGRITARLAVERATVDELHAAQVRVDNLRRGLADARLQISRLGDSGSVAPVKTLLARLGRAERAVHDADAHLRRMRAWEMRIMGGYDLIVGVDRRLPVFGLATLSLNLGAFAQGRSERRARDAHERWAQVRKSNVLGATAEDKGVVRTELDESRRRLAEVKAFEGELHKRHAFLAGLDSDQAQTFASQVWLDLVGIRAEAAFHAGRLAALERTHDAVERHPIPKEKP